MNLNQLQYFEVLAREEHFTRAAQQLSITQPSLSHAIHLLEEELGTKLFEKRGRNVVLTKYGKAFLPYVKESLHILDEGVKRTRYLNGSHSGEIHLAYIYTLGSHFAPRMVREFLDAYPQYQIDFQFKVGATGEILDGLKEEKYDLVFSSYQEGEPELEFVRIGQQKLVVVVPKEHPLAQYDSIDLRDTLEEPMIYFPKTSGLRVVIDQLYEKLNKFPRIVYEMEEDSSMAGLVAQGFGIAVMPQIPILQTLPVKTLTITSPEYERYVYMAQVKNRYQSPAVQAFAAYVQSQAKA